MFFIIFILNLGTFDIKSFFVESILIFNNRNSGWAVGSEFDTEHPGFRKFNPKYINIMKMGFNSQLFYIALFFSLAYNIVFQGLETIIQTLWVPWNDVLFIPIMILCKNII